MKTYLIQRGKFDNRDNKKGIDSIVEFDYMGASEYEWGALPESLKRIRTSIEDYTYMDVPVYGKIITVFCNSDDKPNVKTYLETLADGKMRIKMGSYFDKYVKPSKYDKEWQEKHPLSTNFWWDLENDLMFWVKDVEFETKFKVLIQPQDKQ